jgi:hypothetical protein
LNWCSSACESGLTFGFRPADRRQTKEIAMRLVHFFRHCLVRLGGYAIALLLAFGALRDSGELPRAFGTFVAVGAIFGTLMLLLACAAILYGWPR